MLLKSYKEQFYSELYTLYEVKEIEHFFYLITEHFHNLKRIDLALNPDFALSEKQVKDWNTIVKDLKNNKPIQYILGETDFFGLKIVVNENTLIPRPETEELVQLIIDKTINIAKENTLTILDIGTGSGCIAIALAKNISNSQVFALDVSQKALETAQKNAEINNMSINFVQSNILEVEDLGNILPQFDIIVSNPPYVRQLEKHQMQANVLDYEPHLALFVENDDALLFYRKITQLAYISLKENGKLFFEINQYLGNETAALIKQFGFDNVQLKKDIYGNDRIIQAEKK